MSAVLPSFDLAAADYDERFTHSYVGTLLRRAVWRRLDDRFRSGDRVLELNCGTGEDALHLAGRGVEVVATDASMAMLRVAVEKIRGRGLGHLAETRALAIEDLSSPDAAALGRFDGVLSNFGGLNCVADLEPVAAGLAPRLHRGATAVLCLMGPLVPWEWIWYLAHAQPRRAFRRLRPGGVSWRGITVRYPSVGTVARAFRRHFDVERVAALGSLTPPPFAEPWAKRHRAWTERLNRCERRLETLRPLAWLADHYLIELRRR